MTAADLREQILNLVTAYHREAFPAQSFVPGDPILIGGRVFDADELVHLVDASLDFWLTAGRYAQQFEKDFAAFCGTRYALLCNSGSSANLLAVSALTSPKMGEDALQPGDEVITVATGFPTTVNPIVQNGLVPVFVDVTLPTYNMDVTKLEAAYSQRTRAVMIAHTLGNPFDLEAVLQFCNAHGLYLVEDCCDAVGSLYHDKMVGTFGSLATVSFFPAHHIAMGEGGCVLTDSPLLKKIVESFRDWGRDCWCAAGKENTCGKRFGWQAGGLPGGFDHKYIYTHRGYNLRLTDMQAAVGVAQLKKLPGFIEARKRNFAYLLAGAKALEEFFILPEATPGSDPAWFGFPLTVRESAPFTRRQLISFLDARGIGTRLIFAGNLTRQPAYQGVNYRKVGELPNSDRVMNQSFWVGVYPGLGNPQLDYVIESLTSFCLEGWR